MRFTLTTEKALQIAKEVAAQRRRWGKQVAPPYTNYQLLEVFELLDDAGHFETAVADAAKLRRQLQASNARETRLKQQLAEKLTDSNNMSESGDSDHVAAPPAV